MKKFFLGIFAAAILSASSISLLTAEESLLRDDVPDSHTVVKGDTLWDISARFLKNPWMWPEIWHVNTQIENPHLIYPGDVVRLVYFSGRPRLELDTTGRIYRMEPQARVLSVGEAIPTIPLDQVDSFLSRSRVVEARELESAPYVVTGQHEHLIVGAGQQVYVRGDVKEKFVKYGFFRRGTEFIDPETREKLGVQALDIASGEVREIHDELATLLVTRSNEEVRTGDRLLRQEERAIDSTFYPSAYAGSKEGVILAVEGGLTQVGKMDVVVINRGAREGVVSGNVMSVHKRGKKIVDRVSGQSVMLPDERAGLLMVFRVFEKVSFGLVLESSRGLSVNDKVKAP